MGANQQLSRFTGCWAAGKVELQALEHDWSAAGEDGCQALTTPLPEHRFDYDLVRWLGCALAFQLTAENGEGLPGHGHAGTAAPARVGIEKAATHLESHSSPEQASEG